MGRVTRIQTDEFYEEAENLSTGWGKYLRHIDELREKFDNHEPMDIKEAAWVLYAEYNVPSSSWRKFIYFTENLSKQKIKFEHWKEIFDVFAEIME